jgi:hypothetical protein
MRLCEDSVRAALTELGMDTAIDHVTDFAQIEPLGQNVLELGRYFSQYRPFSWPEASLLIPLIGVIIQV